MKKVISVNTSKKKGVIKTPVRSAFLKKNWGIKDDAHSGNWDRQISILSKSSIDYMKRKYKIEFSPGSFAENLTVEGFDVYKLKIGAKLKIGNVILQITQIGKKCHKNCNIKKLTGYCIMPKQGVFARVISSGFVKTGDKIKFLEEDICAIQ